MNTTTATVHKFCKLHSLSITYNNLRLGIESMPSWPSLWSIYRFLNLNGIDCTAVTGTKEDILSLNNKTALIHTVIKGNDEILLVKASKNGLLYFSPFKHRWSILPDEILADIWDGVMLFSDKKIKPHFDFTIAGNIIFILTSLVFVILAPTPEYKFSVSIATLGMVTSLYYWKNIILDENRKIIPLCKIGKKFDCAKIATSDKSSVFGLPVIVFSMAYFINLYIWLSYLIIADATIYLSSINTIAAIIFCPIATYSLAAQFSIKKFCPYCIFTVVLVGIQSFLSLSEITLVPYFTISYAASAGIVIIASWTFHTRVKLIEQQTDTEIKFRRLKRDKAIISVLLSQSSMLNSSEIKTPFSSGTGNPIRIDIWLTDNCKFCSALLNELESLKGLISEFYLNIYPLCSSSTKYSPLTTRICRLCNSTYLQDGALKDIKESAVNLGISAFPTIAINGRILPSHLTLSDIVYSKCG